ncbi:hypothetical protein E1281_35505 [Actinomadura sp. KC345]|uniref:hypothetical protein n=1 Tax=Actinomadura sp. KC345 TaxID=2530371 RepID=UPI001050B42F|nr:hypothetical protein [Actinomadura sp. KC345]TDC43051.1 hypothetical protein E1281_35505 [Actinomadura sp. KC345]
MASDEMYEVRYGPTLKNTVVLAASVLFTLGCLIPGMPLIIRVLGIALFGTGSLLFLAFMVVRRVAFRVDANGITVAGSPLRYQATLLSVPWTEVQAVVLWKQHTARNMPYVGVQRHKDGPGQPGAGSRRVLGALTPHVPADVAHSSRAVNGRRLDRDRLAIAVAHFAPHVEIADLG